jgi:ferric-dicitrate binding protein FerR (iron transport regulator)
MSLPDNDLLELNALCNALVDDAITDADRARLEAILAQSEDARRFYVRAMALSASLFDYAGEMQADAPDAPAPARVVRIPAWVWTLGSLAAAACIVAAFWLGAISKRGASAETAAVEQDADESIARLSGAKDCRWSGTALKPGDELRRGQRIELAGGFAEITFDSGAQITIEGPASLDLGSEWDATLRRGTLKASVPPEAIGFHVSNSSVDVVDLGTEFTMVADDNGDTEVFVLKGSVEAAARDAAGNAGQPVVLRERQARRFAKAGVSDVRDRDAKLAKFARRVAFERLAGPANSVRWSFDEEGGAIARADTTGFASGNFDARIEPDSAADSADSRTAGRWNGALHLDGKLFAKAPFPGISKRATRTVAFWINVPADAPLPDAGTMLGWPLAGPNRALDIAWNRNPTHGALGALRTTTERGWLVGSTPLRDGRWHHLAIVLVPKPKSDTALQVKQYVDGRFEAPSARHPFKRARGPAAGSLLASGDDTIWIGRKPGDASQSAAQFRGAIDELFIADRALTPPEIRQLMLYNKLSPSDTLAAD